MLKVIRRTGLCLLILSSAQSGWAEGATDLEALLEGLRKEYRMPGLRAAVRTREGEIYRAAVGLADKENEIPLDNRIGMPGGSTGKTFVATLAMLLVEDGILSPEDLASRWLGETEWFNKLPNADEIRVKHLLSHSSGLRDYPDSWRCNLLAVNRILFRRSIEASPEELIGCVTNRRPLFAVGEGFYYSDAGYLVLGRLIEAASGRAYFELLRERILDPLALHDIRPADRAIMPNMAPGYATGARNMRRDGSLKYNPVSEWTGGGLVTTPTMLAQFFGALAEGRIVRPETLRQMLDAGWRAPNDGDQHYGYGLFVYEAGASFGHGGMWPGYRSHVMHDAESGITIAVQTNRDGRLDMQAIVDRVSEHYHKVSPTH